MAERLYKFFTVGAGLALPLVALETHGRGVRLAEANQKRIQEEAKVTQLRQELKTVRAILSNAEGECSRLRGSVATYEQRTKWTFLTEVLVVSGAVCAGAAGLLR